MKVSDDLYQGGHNTCFRGMEMDEPRNQNDG